MSFSSSTTNPRDGEKIILGLKITNQGPGKSAPSRIQIDVDDVPLTVVDMAGLGPNETAQQSFSWQAESGLHTIKATADISNAVWEIDERNNEKSLELSVLSGQEPESLSGSPEVTISSSEASNPLVDVSASITGKITDIKIGEHLILTMRVANAGNTDVHFNAKLVLPDVMNIVSPDSKWTGDNTYVFNLNLEAGKDTRSDILINSIRVTCDQGDIDSEGLIGELATLSDQLYEFLFVLAANCGDKSEAAGIGDGCRQFCSAQIRHCAADYGIFNAEQLGQPRFEHLALS